MRFSWTKTIIDLFLKPAHSCAVGGTVTSGIRQRHEEDVNEGQEERQRDVTEVAVFPLLLQGKQVAFVNREETNVIEDTVIIHVKYNW